MAKDNNKALKLPEKRTMNLAQTDKKSFDKQSSKILLIVGILLALVVVWRYVGVALDYHQVKEDESRAAELEQQLQEANYDKLKAEYDSYARNYLNETERKYESKMDFIRAAKSACSGNATIKSITVTGNEAVIKIEVPDLDRVAAIRSQLENNSLINAVKVYTADTKDNETNVNASIVYTIGSPVEEK